MWLVLVASFHLIICHVSKLKILESLLIPFSFTYQIYFSELGHVSMAFIHYNISVSISWQVALFLP